MKKMSVLAVMAVMMLAVTVSQQADAAPSPEPTGCTTALKFNTCKLNRQSKIIAYNFKRSNGDKQCASASLSASPPTCIVFPCLPNSVVLSHTFVFRDG